MKAIYLVAGAAIIAGISLLAVAGVKEGFTCPVMESKVNNIEKPRGGYADVKGVRYFLCCNDCKPEFEKNPQSIINKHKGANPIGLSLFDTVSQKAVSADTQKAYYDYKGVRYLFLSESNRNTFKSNPAKYAKVPANEKLACAVCVEGSSNCAETCDKTCAAHCYQSVKSDKTASCAEACAGKCAEGCSEQCANKCNATKTTVAVANAEEKTSPCAKQCADKSKLTAAECKTSCNTKASYALAGTYTDYKDVRYYFCCSGCKTTFNKTPSKFSNLKISKL